MKENFVKVETYLDAAKAISNISRYNIIGFPMSHHDPFNDVCTLKGLTFSAEIEFNHSDRAEKITFYTIGGSVIEVSELQTDNPVVKDLTEEMGVV